IKVSGGQRYRVWEQIPGRANEALDCRVYSYAALCGLMYMGLKLNALADAVAGNPERLIAPAVNPETKVNLRFPGAIIPEETNEKPQRKRISQLLP
ncbi:terminase gpA endonuclease subunit, partial [Morganella morganii]